MADNYVGTTNIAQHAGANLAGVGAFLLPIQILSANVHVRTSGIFDGDIKINVGRANSDFIPRMSGNQGQEIAEVVSCLIGILVHLPVGGHQLFAGHDCPFKISYAWLTQCTNCLMHTCLVTA